MGGKINSIKELMKLSKCIDSFDDGFECYVALNFGCKSSKIIRWHDNRFHVIHEIDGSEEFISAENLIDTNIGLAIQRGALIRYDI